MKQLKWKKIVATLVIVGLAWGAERMGLIDLKELSGSAPSDQSDTSSPRSATLDRTSQGKSSSSIDEGTRLIADAFRAHRSGFMVQVEGTVHRSLPDDNDGSRHQRFILKLSDGATVLVAHNIDLAERVPLERGDVVELKGQYEWSDQGGVLHWTHGDPRGSHEEGWIEFEGTRFE